MLGYEREIYHSYLVTINNKRIQGITKLNEIVTSQSNPLTFTFLCSIQFEEAEPTKRYCLPTMPIVSLQNNDPSFIKERVKMGSQIWSLSTSESDPLILKEPRVMVTIDGKKHKDIVCYRNVAEFVKVASENANTKLYPPIDQHGSQVTDLST